jgi:hypothetical protein
MTLSRNGPAILAAALLLRLTTQAQASLTPVYMTPNSNEASLILPSEGAANSSGYDYKSSASGDFTLGAYGAGSNLGILDKFYPGQTLVRVDDENDQTWPFTGVTAAIKIEVKYAGDYSYIGVSASDGSQQVDIFGPKAPGVLPGIVLNPSLPTGIATLSGNVVTLYNNGSSDVTNPFDWTGHDTTTGTYWNSNPSFNSDGMDHFVTWQITTGPDAGSYVIAYEDRTKATSDKDYNDLVFQVSLAAPAPEPSTLAIAGLGGLALIGYSIRRRRGA